MVAINNCALSALPNPSPEHSSPLATNTPIPHHPLPILIVIHPNLPHELHHVPLPQFQQQRAQRQLLAPVQHPHQRLHDLACLENVSIALFAATSLPHLQQQFLSLFIVLHVANLHAGENKKGAPISRSALRFNVARVFRVSRVPTLVSGRPKVSNTSRPCRAVSASRIILRGRRRAFGLIHLAHAPPQLLFSSVGATQFSPARKGWEPVSAPCTYRSRRLSRDSSFVNCSVLLFVSALRL